MSQLSTLLTILMDRKTHTREELLSLIYKKVRGTHSGRLAARVDQLRKRGYEIESPKVKYKNGKKVLVKRLGFKRDQRSFWYKLIGSKTIWKKVEEKHDEKVHQSRSLASIQAARTVKKNKAKS